MEDSSNQKIINELQNIVESAGVSWDLIWPSLKPLISKELALRGLWKEFIEAQKIIDIKNKAIKKARTAKDDVNFTLAREIVNNIIAEDALIARKKQNQIIRKVKKLV